MSKHSVGGRLKCPAIGIGKFMREQAFCAHSQVGRHCEKPQATKQSSVPNARLFANPASSSAVRTNLVSRACCSMRTTAKWPQNSSYPCRMCNPGNLPGLLIAMCHNINYQIFLNITSGFSKDITSIMGPSVDIIE